MIIAIHVIVQIRVHFFVIKLSISLSKHEVIKSLCATHTFYEISVFWLPGMLSKKRDLSS